MNTVTRLSVAGLQHTGPAEFFEVEHELQLALVAAKAVAALPAPDQARIAAIAPLKAWTEAIRKFTPEGKSYTLRNRLKRFTKLWAVRYGEHVQIGKPLPDLDPAEAIEEALRIRTGAGEGNGLEQLPGADGAISVIEVVSPIEMPMAVFDLDGTLRSIHGSVFARAEGVKIYPGVAQLLLALRKAGFLLIGATNQGCAGRGILTIAEVEAALDRTQELLGPARLDAVMYCPHDLSADQHICDCKKPAAGMILNALQRFPKATLRGTFVVGDNGMKDGGMAAQLALPFLKAESFRSMSPEQMKDWLRTHPPGADEFVAPDPDRVMGALVGLAVGDALGAPLEFLARTQVRARFPRPLREMVASRLWKLGEFTDDTQMALLLAESMLEKGHFAAPDIAARFLSWSRTSKDVGIQTAAVLHSPDFLEQPEFAALRHYETHPKNSAGNGAVMRCAPVALFHLNSLSRLLADSRRSARITHGDPKAQSSCVLLNVWIREAILHGTRDARAQGMRFLTPLEQKPWARLSSIEHLPEAEISSVGYTVSTVEAAVWSFLTTDTFEAAVVRAANLGDDADTVAAVTGALAGAYYGYRSIPERWRDPLLDERRIRHIALRLAGLGEPEPRTFKAFE